MSNLYRNALSEMIFGRKADGSCCVACGSTKVNPEDFADDVSRKEFQMSRMCQVCQDIAFAEPEDDE